MQLRWGDVAAVAAVALVLFTAGRSANSTVPTATVRPECGEIVRVLAGRTAEAKQLASFYRAAAEMVERDGRGARVLTTRHQLRTALERAAILRFQGAFVAVPGLSDAIHGPSGALARMLGLEAGPLDHGAAAAALRAVADACEAVR